MESPKPQSPVTSSMSSLSHSTKSRTSTRLPEELLGLTSFNPFAEEDEYDQSSYNLVASFLSKMKSISSPLSSAVAAASTSTPSTVSSEPLSTANQSGASEPRRPSLVPAPISASSTSTKTTSDRPHSFLTVHAQAAPPLVSLTPAQSEVPTFSLDSEHNPQRHTTATYSPYETHEGVSFGNSIPGFPIADDTRSIKTATTLHRSNSVSKVMRKVRGDGLSRNYWMDDENAKECYDCKSVFTTWRRKHHCRICGQIFCSRCASNVIKGTRFGHDGMIRVCNKCLNELTTGDQDDNDDRGSIVSSVTFAAHQLGGDGFGLGRHPQSPFSSSQIFSRDETFNLFAKPSWPSLYGSDDDSGSRLVFAEDEDGLGRETPAPFRRAMSDEGDGLNSAEEPIIHEEPPAASPTPAVDKRLGLLSVDVGNNPGVPFPGSPDHDSPRPESRIKNSFYGDYGVSTPFIRSRVHSRLDSIGIGEVGWRTRRESTASSDLNNNSMAHLRTMLKQMLTLEQIPNAGQWEEVLHKLALRVAKEMTFTAIPHRQGQDMDVRRYVKIKKIPGGTPKDSEYVNGAVITKNVAHKKMARTLHNPRVMLVTFPLEFHRIQGQYMQFGQILRQEKEYLTNLASRLAALRPHVILVERSVSRLALDALANHNIAVARSVKPSAIQNVARMTQGDVLSSMDKLALEPRLGHCARFRIQTYDHHLIPGRRKTFMRFEGCSRDMGCTIILRGGDIETLRRVKRVMRFLTFIVRNLRLETQFWLDSAIAPPTYTVHATPHPPSDTDAPSSSRTVLSTLLTPSTSSQSGLETPTVESIARIPSVVPSSEGDKDDGPVDEDEEQRRLTIRINESLKPYHSTFISVSAALRFPPPYPIQRMKELDDELLAAKQEWEDEIIRKEEQWQAKHQQEATFVPSTASNVRELEQQQQEASGEQEDISAQIEALALPSALSSTPPSTEGFSGSNFASPAPMEEGESYFTSNPHAGATLSVFLPPQQPGPQEKEPLKTEADIQLQSKYTLTKWKHEEQRRVWEWYLRKNKDDFIVEKYQCISIREYTVPTEDPESNRPCFPPTIEYITFYGENDLALAQFIEKSVHDSLAHSLDPKAICQGKTCGQPLARHARVFIHNETRVFVAVERWDKHVKPPSPVMITWTACRICGHTTSVVAVSPEMQRYSFAKFLEAYFYPADVKFALPEAGCSHNIFQYHIRYFETKGIAMQFHADPIVLHELVFPPFRIRVRPETQLEIKNTEFLQLHDRNNLWYDGLVHDLKQYAIEAATGDEEADTKLLVDINGLINKAETERQNVSHLVNTIYRESPPTDTLILSQVHAYRQDRIVTWQQDFDRLQKLRPSPSDRSSKRTSTFGTMRGIWPRKYDTGGPFSDPNAMSSGVSETEEGPIKKPRRVTGHFASSASETSETESTQEKEGKSTEKPPISSIPPEKPSSQLQIETESANLSEPAVLPPSDEQSGGPKPLKDLFDQSERNKTDSDPDSDSTIGVARGEPVRARKLSKKKIPHLPAVEVPVSRLSRLPRRIGTQPSVAELVRKYSDYIPPQGVQELSKTAFRPRSATMSESEQEDLTFSQRRTIRNRNRHASMRKPSISDFEQSYAVNVAPRYSTQPRRGLIAHSRGPGFSRDSRGPSRRQSPEKRRSKDATPSRPVSPNPQKSGPRPSKLRTPSRTHTERPSRAPSVGPSTSKPAFRRSQQAPIPGGKVSNMARHYERLGRDVERTKSKYAVLRGKRARPVVNTRAKVEILESIKDVIADESESSDSSSEADDEGDGLDDVDEPLSKMKSKDPITATETTPSTAETATVPVMESTTSEIAEISAPVDPSTDVTQDVQPVPMPSESISVPPSPFLAPKVKPGKDAPLTPPVSDTEGSEKMPYILKAFSSFLSQTQNFFELDDPFGDPEHIFRDSAMVVRLDEPTSIIALALNSPQYREMLAKSRAEKRTARVEAKLMEGSEAFMPDDRSTSDSASTWGVVNVDAVESIDPTEDLRMASSKLPWAITFESGGLTISCTVLYPEQFDALRRTYDCEKSMVESLARCVNWNASGGKSGSAFLKTQDDRFIAKELSRAELQTMETFAPAYFDYMSSAVSADRPTLLAKVFGCYKLTFKKTGKERSSGKNKSTQMNLLVMENLFYDRRFAKIYDLKGSTRNRHVQSTGQENEVLLDENLVEKSHKNPFYLREHSKRILRGALYNDSKFLADINVMDYSLVCGVDNKNHELVVGIVDYIRTYTWDKKLESWVKESTFLGGVGKGEPTIVTPKQYRQRFLGAMERYFPLVPDRWMKNPDQPEEDSSTILSDLWPDW